METLISVAVWAGLFFVMMRFGCGAHMMKGGHKHGSEQKTQARDDAPELRWIPAEKDIDPVCKKTVATSTAKSSVYEGKVYYFCSRDCREVFEAAPDLYADAGDDTQKQLEQAHV